MLIPTCVFYTVMRILYRDTVETQGFTVSRRKCRGCRGRGGRAAARGEQSAYMRFSSLDVYPKTLAEFRQRTLTGAIVSITCITLIALLTCIEVVDFAQVSVGPN